MSATIYWSPIKKGRVLPTSAPSSLWEAITDGDCYTVFDANSIAYLRGVKAGDKSHAEAIDELIEAIEKHGSIRITREF